MWEEGSLGHTVVIKLHDPADIGYAGLRAFVIDDCYKGRGLQLFDAAVELAKPAEAYSGGLPCDTQMEAQLKPYASVLHDNSSR